MICLLLFAVVFVSNEKNLDNFDDEDEEDDDEEEKSNAFTLQSRPHEYANRGTITCGE